MEAFWGSRGVLGPLLGALGRSWTLLGRSWEVLGPFFFFFYLWLSWVSGALSDQKKTILVRCFVDFQVISRLLFVSRGLRDEVVREKV